MTLLRGVTVAGAESRIYRFLTHRYMKALGKFSYTAYLLQFPVWWGGGNRRMLPYSQPCIYLAPTK